MLKLVHISKSGPMCDLGSPFLINMLHHVNGLVQDCSNSIANTLELLQSCTKPSM